MRLEEREKEKGGGRRRGWGDWKNVGVGLENDEKNKGRF